MDQEEFWDLIERSRRHSTAPGPRLAWLEEQLIRRPLTDICDFQIRQDETRVRSNTYALWGAADQIFDGFCSDDSFWYFQPWLLGLGRDAFDRVTANPDALADLPEIQRLAGRPTRDWSDEEWPEWELFNYLATTAYERLTGNEDGLVEAMAAQGHDTAYDPRPSDSPWKSDDPAEVARRLPHLSALFPTTGAARRM